jgi:hypothetical protein
MDNIEFCPRFFYVRIFEKDFGTRGLNMPKTDLKQGVGN